MSDYKYGLCVPHKYANSMESYCDNNEIRYQYWAGISEPSVSGDVEYHFETEKDREKASKWVNRLRQLEHRL